MVQPSARDSAHLGVPVHGGQVQGGVSGAGPDVQINGDGVLLGEGQQLGQQLRFALLGGPVEAGEAGHEVPLGHECGLHGQQRLQAVPQAVRGAQHPLVLQRVEGDGGAVFVGGGGEEGRRVAVALHGVAHARTAADQRPADLIAKGNRLLREQDAQSCRQSMKK